MDSKWSVGTRAWKHWVIAGFLLSCTTGVRAEPVSLEIPMAQQRNLSFERPVTNVALGSPEIADVKVLGKQEILISSKKLGSTTLKVWVKGKGVHDYDLRVTPGDGLRAALDDAGLEVGAVGNGLLLGGSAQSLPAHAAALNAAQHAVANKDQVFDRSEMGFKHQVQTDIKIVEISHTKLKDAGFFLSKNSSSVTAAVAPPSLLSNVVGTGGNFNLGSDSGFLPSFESFNFVLGRATDGILGVLSVLEGNGFASALAEPSLVTLSGQDASFLVGGEFPIPVRKGSGDDSSVSIEYKEFGIRLFLTPTVLSKSKIMLRVAPEVSELDFSNGIETGGVAVPSLKVRRTETSVELGDGESFVISGLVSKDTIANVNKVPGLGDIPVLGAFFRSSRLSIKDRELIMIVTPHLVSPIAATASLPPLPGERERNYDPDFGEFMFRESGRFGEINSIYGFSD